MASVVHNRTGEFPLIRGSRSGIRSVTLYVASTESEQRMKSAPPIWWEGAADGLARAEKFMELTGQEFEPVTSANRHLPAEAMFGMPLGSNWNSDYAVTECTSDSQFQLVDYEDYEMFYQNVDHSYNLSTDLADRT